MVVLRMFSALFSYKKSLKDPIGNCCPHTTRLWKRKDQISHLAHLQRCVHICRSLHVCGRSVSARKFIILRKSKTYSLQKQTIVPMSFSLETQVALGTGSKAFMYNHLLFIGDVGTENRQTGSMV